jgi:hypothetical protein
MRILSQDGFGVEPTELFIALHDGGCDPCVWRLDVVGEEVVFFEAPSNGDALMVVEAAFEARKGLRGNVG